MATSLRDIPGPTVPARGDGPIVACGPGRPHHPRHDSRLATPRGPKPRGLNRPQGRIDLFLVVLVLAGIGVVVWLAMAFSGRSPVPTWRPRGIDDGRATTPEAAEDLDTPSPLPPATSCSVPTRRSTASPSSRISNRRPTAPRCGSGPAHLVETETGGAGPRRGRAQDRATVGRLFLGDSTFRWSYVVDSIAPTFGLPTYPRPRPDRRRGDGARHGGGGRGAAVPRRAPRHRRRRVLRRLRLAPTGALEFKAVDEAGNSTTAHVVVPVVYPDSSRAIHVSGAAWANDEPPWRGDGPHRLRPHRHRRASTSRTRPGW